MTNIDNAEEPPKNIIRDLKEMVEFARERTRERMMSKESLNGTRK